MTYLLAVLRHRWLCRPPCRGHLYLSRPWPGHRRHLERYRPPL